MKKPKLRVLLVDDHSMVLSGLRLLLENTPDLTVVSEAVDKTSALEDCAKLKPDVVVLDINLGEFSGLDILPEIKSVSQECKILLLTMYGEEAYMKKALEEGANGYILKKASALELLSAVRAVGRGETYLDPALAASFISQVLGRKQLKPYEPSQDDSLSSREKEVLRLVALGYTNQQIAKELTISIKTVETHKAHIKIKLGMKRRSDLVQYVMDNHLLS